MNIETKHLKKSYYLQGREIPVLLGLDFTIQSGEFVSLTGPSGVGKSTLLHILGTLDTPSSGWVHFDGIDIFGKNSAEIAEFRNQNIGFVFQFHHLLPELTALENAMMPLLVRRVNRTQAIQRAKEILAMVGLAERLQHKPGELSGGEQQRVALARALVGEPKLLLADEPTGNLDEATGFSILQLMKRFNKERGVTTLYVTHNPRLAAESGRQLLLSQLTHTIEVADIHPHG